MQAIYDGLKEKNPICGKCMGSLTHISDKQSPAVQAADLLASLCKDAFEITLSGAAQNPKLEEL